MNTDCAVIWSLSCIDFNMYVGRKMASLRCSTDNDTQQTINKAEMTNGRKRLKGKFIKGMLKTAV